MKRAPWLDRLYVGFAGGVRIRLESDGESTVAGQVDGPPPPKLVEIVRDLARGKTGRVDLWRDRSGHWLIKTQGELASPSMEQRLRNVLGNL